MYTKHSFIWQVQLKCKHNIRFILILLSNQIVYCLVGLQFGVGKRLLSDTGSFVQTDWIDSEFLHSSGRHDTHIHADRSTFGCKKAKPSDWYYAQFKSK